MIRTCGRNFAVGALAVSVFLTGCSGSTSSKDSRTIRVTLGELRFAPDALTVASGTRVRFILTNGDAIDHEFVLGAKGMDHSTGGHNMAGSGAVAVPAGKTAQLDYTFSESGTVPFACYIAAHDQQGMKGQVTVTS